MSRENVEVVRRIVDAVNRGDVDAAIESLSHDFEADWRNSRGLQSGLYRGRRQARELFASFLEAWASLRARPEELIELEDDRVLSVNQTKMRGHGSGVEVSVRGAMIWTIRDGDVAAVTLYQSKADALEAAGRR